MYKLIFGLFLCVLVLTQTTKGQSNNTRSSKEDTYKPPCSAKYPLGDEEFNTDMLKRPGVNEAHEKKGEGYKDFDGRCPVPAPGGPTEDCHTPCEEEDSAEIIYTSASLPTPEIQCKKCDLKTTPDDSFVVVHCFNCYDIPVPDGVNKDQEMWSNIIKLRQFSRSALPRQSQVVTAQLLPEDPTPDIEKLKIGETLHGFQVQKVEDISVFNITAVQLQHLQTKAQYLHLFRNDINNVFSINFRTTPRDSTGLPHILEHLVLCGSKLYPVRDPFFKMLNRSLATFMNAMTGSDYTVYPFSTQNFTDFRNLQKIYLDAVFRPNLLELDFMQEGWRLENENPQDSKSSLVIKGVVYNEMKGAFSENERILMEKLLNLILPDHTYGVCSGGDPLKIPNLTWNDLKKFHADHYHPSNARFYSYGNFPLLPTLEYLNKEYLANYQFQDCKTVVPQQQRWSEEKTDHIECRYENIRETIGKQNTITISFLMCDIRDIYQTCLLQFITELLIRGPNSPFYKSLIEPGFSGGFTPSTGFDTQPRDSVFVLGLQGLKRRDFGKVIKIFDTTIDDIIKKGFERKHIESVLHQYELTIKHETNNFGLNLLLGLTPLLNHDGDIVMALKVDQLIEKLRKDIDSDSKFLQHCVTKYFKENKHRLILSMSPNMEYETNLGQLEKQLIQNKTQSLNENDKRNIQQKALELLEAQSKPQNANVLPTLQIQDINSEAERILSDKVRCGPVHTQINTVNSNGVTYFKGILNMSELTPEQQMFVPLLCNVITKLGTNELNFEEFDNFMSRKTAGLNLNIHVADSLFQLNSYEPGIILSSYCLDKNVPSMWDLWKQIFRMDRIRDPQRFQMLVQLYMTNLTHGLATAGHMYAMQAACGLVSGPGYQRELLLGLQHISYMKRLVKTARYDAMLVELCNVAKILFDKNKLRCALNISSSSKDQVYKSYEKFIGELPGNTFGKPNEHSFSTTKIWSPTDSVQSQHHVLNVPVHYCSKAILTAPYTDPEHAQLRVLAKLLSSKYLHPELREKGGAYGGGARLNKDGVFSFFSYRDPNNFKTLDTFDSTYDWMQKNLDNIKPQDILEAKLGVFQSVDAPVPPSSKGSTEFVLGITPDILQRHRAEIMAVSRDSLQQVSEKYLNIKSNALAGKVILGPKSENLDYNKRLGELWTVLDNE